MKKFVLVAFTGLLSFNIANADVIKCVFTEPFVDSTYDTSTEVLKYQHENEKPEVIKDVSFRIVRAGKFELVSKQGKVLQTLRLNNSGSDGMSDIIYPYDVRDTGFLGKNSPNKGMGGCSSEKLTVVGEG